MTKNNTNVIIGIGDSWTQGEGGYPEHIWKENNGRMWKKLDESKHLIPIEHENSWVNKLAISTNSVAINLGQRAIGNRGAARTLYLNDFSKFSNGTIVFMLSGFDRFDLFKSHWNADHYQFETLWPFQTHKKQHVFYGKHLYSEEAAAVETACSIIEVQNFAKANGFKFIFANGFELRGKEYFDSMCPSVSKKINWDRYIHTHTDYDCFARLFVRKDGLCNEDYETVISYYKSMDWPATYMTNDMHPTIKGYDLIASEIQRIYDV